VDLVMRVEFRLLDSKDSCISRITPWTASD
jgi:hypothetical protein